MRGECHIQPRCIIILLSIFLKLDKSWLILKSIIIFYKKMWLKFMHSLYIAANHYIGDPVSVCHLMSRKSWYVKWLMVLAIAMTLGNNTRFYRHDDVIKWKHIPRNWPFVRGIHRTPMNSPHKGQRRGALMFSLICVWINGWVNNHEAGDLRCYRRSGPLWRHRNEKNGRRR